LTRAVVEEKLAWCVAVHAPRDVLDRLREALAAGEYDAVESSANAMLPRARAPFDGEPVRPVRDGDETLLDNALVHARTNERGVLLELTSPRTRVPVSQCNLLFGLGRSPSGMEIELRRGEPFLRVALNVEWRGLWGALRLENWLAMSDASVRYGIDRRLAALEDERAGLAIFAAPQSVWRLRALARGGAHLRLDLLRRRGAARLHWAFAPYQPGISFGVLEAAWDRFAYGTRVRLFTSEDPAIVVTACAPAPGGDGVMVRVREVDGAQRPLRLRCGARMRAVEGDTRIEGEELCSDIAAFGEREFRVRF